VRLNPETPVNTLEQISNGKISDQPVSITLRPYEVYWVELSE
jgi:hypothetical protein